MTLKERRLAENLRQVDVAKKVGVDQASVSLWERGKVMPTRKYHRRLAKIYKCSLDELMCSINATEEKNVSTGKGARHGRFAQ